MKKFNWKALSLTCICAVFMVIGATDTFAYQSFLGGCNNCHGDFKTTKHDLHKTLVGGNCGRCHIKNGDDPVTSLTADTPDRGCVGCHGRSEDAGNDGFYPGLGAGLRQHHYNSGQTSCAGCHSDANPSNYTPVGEDISPPFYTVEGLVACSDSLDNDGDLDYDGADPDCIQIIDTDSDGVPDNEDNCPSTWQPNQADSDADGTGDWCDNCPSTWQPNQNDSDSDSLGDWCDNCPSNCNTQQLDADEDGIGDVCDLEDDGCDGCGSGIICEVEC
jgi:hypothetical protein